MIYKNNNLYIARRVVVCMRIYTLILLLVIIYAAYIYTRHGDMTMREILLYAYLYIMLYTCTREQNKNRMAVEYEFIAI